MQKLKQEKKIGIGENLRRLRISKGFSQVEVVARLELYGINICRVTYNKMEHNNYSIRINELLALKMIYDCEFKDFFIGLKFPSLQNFVN
ncbi:helix-turn-helix domain-containing protein [Enterocloster sp. OA13]|uniref:helix-turn-helix domain-containing protein n=1 Tax=Enterocloster sp. OA13 TaxID=2914161 RepID=UPI0006860B9D|nr:helix-turn-helix domain-containing protein [Enterocloster sp. OA13]